ncbi:hypothetical protein FH972_010338 [Carpinus fangiana]|uniref:FAE domain-containing protein n=1 Tax=Carpinus fangiana TaxID=176857 RepID=A0A660KUY6_9ROSI|nr:hypothetical protein FH972_010338 [Carpinus fangiana]
MANARVRSRLGDSVLELDSFPGHHLLHNPNEKSLLGELCVLQAGGGAGVHEGDFMERSGLTRSFSEENLAFQKKIVERSGLGQKTYLPEAVLRVPPNPCMAEARKEAEAMMFSAIDELLGKTGVKAT